MATIDELTWSSMTAAINEIKSPNQFLTKLLFPPSQEETLPTETVEISVFSKGREIAPFVRKNGSAINVGGATEKFQTVEAPNIRIKRPMHAADFLFRRRPGTVIFPGADGIRTAAQEHIAREIGIMADMITNSIELLVSQVLTGTISYTVQDEDNFTITFPRPAGHDITSATVGGWDGGTSVDIHKDVMVVKRLMAVDGLIPTDAVMSPTVTSHFVNQTQLATFLDNRNIDAGLFRLQEQFMEDGAILIGRAFGINWWEYPRTVDVNGVSTKLIRDNYVEFVSAVPAAENRLYYGAIPDVEAFEGRLFQSRRFSKSWVEKDPSALMELAHSRPLPVPRRPSSYVSLDAFT